MALSFEESKRMVAASPAMTMEASIEDARPVVDCDEDVATFSVEDQNFTRSGNYTWFDTFSDNDFSTVDTNKEITLSPTQVNITQENNSQVIPFEMPRYYDGVDLMSMTIQIHYVNANNAENYTAPINVSYSTDKIRFYWMVSNYATIKEGVLKFEIMATGAITVPNSGESKNYLWRTKPNEKLNVLKALTGTAMNNPTDDDWYTQFLATMSQKVGEAQTAATQAAQSAQEAQAVVDGLADTLANYYTKEEVDGFVTLLRDDIAKVDGLAKFDVQYDAETQTIKFLNGEKIIKTITLNTDPSADWVTAFNKTVEAKIDEKIAPVKTELTEYKTSNDAAVKNLQDSVGNLPETLQSDYYNKQATNKLLEAKAEKTSVETVANDLTVVKNTASGLQNSIDTINGDISEIQEQLKNVKPDPNSGREYDITYEDSKLSLLENGTVKTQVVIQGGGGGGTGGSTSVIKIERLDGSALTVIAGDQAIINFKFSSVDNSGDDTGSATGVWYVGNTKVGTQTVIQGKNSFDITQYLHSGDNTVKLQVTDSVGSVGTKTWTVNVVEFYIESSFDDTLVYSGEVTFRYTPYGNIAKTINFTIDGKILGSTTSSVTGRQLTYAIPAQTHGAHLVEVSMTAEINGKQVTSNKVVKDIMWATEGNTTPIISCATKTASAKQYSNVAINYTVYDPSSSTTTVTLDLVHWDFCFDYDNDTAMGNVNEGGLTLSYGYEDMDTIGTKSVFNAHDSKLWCKIRDLFADDLAKMFLNRESALAWSATRILKKFEDYQDVKPEKLWIMDMRRKYFRTYEDNGTTNYLPMMHGNKRHQRREFQRYQEKYMASKYTGAACTSDDMTIRGYTPTNWTGVKPDGTFHIVPYADTYVSVRYGSNPVKVRGKRGQTYEIQCPIAAMNDTEVYVYNASIIQSIGDISGFYPGYVDFSHGVKLADLKIGSAAEGYKNTNLTDFAVGNNTLLEHLNLQNVPNLKKSISLTGCTNLEEFYAGGSGITGVAFAKGGKIRKAELPAIASLSAKNLNYLTDLKVTDYKNITTLTVEKCPTIDLTDMLAKCTNLNRVRLTGVDWQLDDTSLLDRLLKMTGLDENGYNTDHSVIEGSVHVPIMRERQLEEFTAQWPDLNITYNTLVQQFVWTFVNKDGTVLDVQYIDKGDKAVDPVTRKENPIPTPTAESTISTDFTFSGWDTEFTTVFSNQTITATYTESVRKYTVRYMNRGAVLKETVAPYGSMVLYDGDTPTYTSEETAFKYYLFSGWDKGGYVTGDKDINAVYDSCEYSSTYFDGKEIGQLRPVEIYAMNKVGVEQNVATPKDEVSIKLGNDFSYEDITEKVLISKPQVFDGKNYIDTDLKLFEEDRDFVLAVDYKMDVTNANNTVLMQCFEQNGMNGIRLWNSTGVKMTWGIDSANGVAAGSRDMTVIRHIKGDNALYVYSSNIYGSALNYTKITRTRSTKTNATLVFGCAKADDGAYERHAKGTVYWSKLWYADLGDAACRELAAWTHDNLIVEVASFKNYYLSDNSNKRCSMTFLQKDTLGQDMVLSSSSNNAGGWGSTSLREYLDSRLVDALPIGWKQLIKKVKVPSSAGNKSKEIVTSDCYFFIPSAIEVSSSMIDEPYVYEGQTISYMTGNDSRVKHNAEGKATKYWLRSPFATYDGYFYAIEETGELYGFHYPSEQLGVTVMFSI